MEAYSQADLCDWAGGHLGGHFDAKSCKAMGWTNRKGLYCVAVFYSFLYNSCEIAIAAISHRYLRPEIMGAMLGYPFEQLGLTRVMAHIQPTNQAALKVFSRYGVVVEGVARDIYGEFEDGLTISLVRRNFRDALMRKAA